MAVKDWLPVAQDIYAALIADGNPKQGKTLKISHKDLCEILNIHNIAVTEDMSKQENMIEESFLVSVVRSVVRFKDLSKSLYENGIFKGDLTDAEESAAYSSYNVPKSLWVYQIAHKLQRAFKNSKAKEEVIKDEKEISEAKENVNKDVEAPIESTKHDKYIKICSEIIKIRRELGIISISDLAKIVGKEFFSNNTTSLFTLPGDKRYIEVLEILNHISLTVNSLSAEIDLEEMLNYVEEHFDKLDEIAESFKDSNKAAEDKQLDLTLEYLDSIKKSDSSKTLGIGEVLKAFVIGKIIADESERVFISGSILQIQILHFMNIINAANFDIKDKTQVDTCKLLLSTIKQAILLNKTTNKFGCFTAGTGKPFPQPSIPGLDPLIYQKATAFDRIVDALRPVFNELENRKSLMQGFGSPLNGWGRNPLF